MSVSGEIQNLAKVEAGPRHQSIGKNGSFWLPKDSPDILKQNPISPKSQKNSFIADYMYWIGHTEFGPKYEPVYNKSYKYRKNFFLI